MASIDRASNACAPDELLERVLFQNKLLLFDGGFGTMLQARGLASSQPAELLCLSDSAAITAIHRAYVEAGSQVVTTNTFRASREQSAESPSIEELFVTAVACARAAGPLLVAADIGPTGELLEPYGELSADEAYERFARQAKAAEAAGADLIAIETMADSDEAVLAVQAAKEHSSLPVFASMSFGEGGRTFMGATAEQAAKTLVEAGADAVGANCSLGPDEMLPIIEQMRAVVEAPLIAQANAGMPIVDGESVTYPVGPNEYAHSVGKLIYAGATIIGGCCGTNPTYIEQLARYL